MSNVKVPLEDLIYSPFEASFETQKKLTMSVMEFVESVGFTNESDNWVANMVTFKYTINRDGNTHENVVNIPLLTLINIPSLNIETVNVEFCANVTPDCQTKKMVGVLCGDETQLGKYKFNITAKTESKSEGLKTLLATLKHSS